MNDRFRFRVFYKPHNKIYNVICLNSDRQKEIIVEYKGSTALVEWKYCDILQSTGLKDKNGRLIYEGDIIKETLIDFINEEIITVVKWDKLNTGYNLENLQNCEREIIGNIYQNPELLEE